MFEISEKLLKFWEISLLHENKITTSAEMKSKCFIIVNFYDYKITIANRQSELKNIKKL